MTGWHPIAAKSPYHYVRRRSWVRLRRKRRRSGMAMQTGGGMVETSASAGSAGSVQTSGGELCAEDGAGILRLVRGMHGRIERELGEKRKKEHSRRPPPPAPAPARRLRAARARATARLRAAPLLPRALCLGPALARPIQARTRWVLHQCNGPPHATAEAKGQG